MRKAAPAIIAAMMAVTLAGCASESTETNGVEQPKQKQELNAPIISANITKDFSFAGVSMKVSPEWKAVNEDGKVGYSFRPSPSSVFSIHVYNDDRCSNVEEFIAGPTILGAEYQTEKTWSDGGTTYTLMSTTTKEGGSYTHLVGYNDQGYSIDLFINYGPRETEDSVCADVKDAVINSISFNPDAVGDAFLGELDKVLNSMGNFEPVTIDGSGDDVIDIPCAGSPCIMNVSNNGGGHFAVKTMDASGKQVDLLVNEIAPYAGIVTDYLNYKNASMIQVSASGPWSITFSPMLSMNRAESGSAFTGDSVVGIDAEAISKVKFTHDGESNFVVKAIGMNKSDLLVNEIGAYDGTVIWNEPKAFFIVSADGTWTITY